MPNRRRSTDAAARRVGRLTAVGAGASALAVALLLVAPALAAPAPFLVQRARINHYAGPNLPSGGGHVSRCAGLTSFGARTGSAGAYSAWLCDRAKVAGSAGYARGVDEVITETARVTGISGTYTYAGIGNLTLPPGWAEAKVTCTGTSSNSTATAFARVYLFYAVWINDTYKGSSVHVTANINYLWNSYTPSCRGPGTSSLLSPNLTGAFNTSGLSGGPFSYSFASTHSYQFEFVLGCAAEASISSYYPGTTAKAICDVSKSTSPAFGLRSVSLY
ncbi:MAG: hypothetical protein L3K19_04885 [Thermoplasmata archaeon]|nr:hypothetical protein [Thermoplasmata archaeon]